MSPTTGRVAAILAALGTVALLATVLRDSGFFSGYGPYILPFAAVLVAAAWERYELVWRGAGLAVLVFAVTQGITPVYLVGDAGGSTGSYVLLLVCLGSLAVGDYLAASATARPVR